ncbi:hypothetical protein F2Q69_00021780 [Brassica cretica]|uniref:Uncharacterized protein n=1 Tax=Brassica cretica TaxID=69181 RepID=A0A8S9Q0Z9_BRACR|nr:hypothetical protein F2Q69_00021780 [Brassica cretica]
MEGSPYRKFSFSQGKGAVLGTGPGVLRSGEPGFLLAGILRTGVLPAGIQRPVSFLGSGGIQYLSFPQARHRSSNPAIPGSTQAGTTL